MKQLYTYILPLLAILLGSLPAEAQTISPAEGTYASLKDFTVTCDGYQSVDYAVDTYIQATLKNTTTNESVVLSTAYGAKLNQIDFSAPSAITTPGNYVLTIPEGKLFDMVSEDDVPAMTFNYTIAGDAPDTPDETVPMTAVPADSTEVEVLDSILLTFQTDQSVYGNSNHPITVQSATGETVSTVTTDVTNGDLESNQVRLVLRTPVTTPGDYTVVMPRGAFIFGEISEAEPSPEYSLHYTVKQTAVADSLPTLWGTVVYANGWGWGTPNYAVYSFKPEADLHMDSLFESPYLNANSGAVTYHNTVHLITSTDYDGYYTFYDYYEIGLNEDKQWSYLDHAEISDGKFNGPGMTYDYTDNTVYGIFRDLTTTSQQYLGKAFLTEDSIYRIANLDSAYSVLAADNTGKLYAITTDGYLVSINKTNGAQTVIGPTGVKPYERLLQSAAIDQRNNKMYWAAYRNNSTSGLYSVDTNTGHATLISDFPNGEEIVGLYVKEPDAADGAPAAVDTVIASFPGGSLSGTVSFTAPTKTFNGNTLSAALPLNYYVVENGDTLATGTVLPGAEQTVSLTLTASGQKTFRVRTSNSAGMSPSTKASLWAGYDLPEGPKKVTLEVSENSNGSRQAKVSWTAPAKGVHDGYIDTDNLKYTVLNLLSGDVISDKQTATTISETLNIDSLATLSYGVIAYNDTLPSVMAKSNQIILNEITYEPPYFEDFLSADVLKEFIIIDNNNDGYTWKYNTDQGKHEVIYHENYSQDADDWLLTPRIHLTAGKKYVVSYSVKCRLESYPEAIQVGYGTESDPSAYTITRDIAVTNKNYINYSDTITVASDDYYRIGFHAVSQKSMWDLALDSISVKAADATATAITGVSSDASDGDANAPTYNLSGQRVDGTYRGVVIRKGKKYVKE